jgi:D-glycero-D-manno-heptose 1,7-bisphosphate phosphatase
MPRDWPPTTTPRYYRAVFLDRDGTINVDTHFPHQAELLEFIPAARRGMRVLAELPLDIVVASNQAGIALGIFTQEEMSRFNATLRSRVEAAGGRIDAFYFCPHLELQHLPPGTPPCECSKPAPGMLLEAARDYELDLSQCFFVGDKTSDIAAGKAVGCTTILVKTGKAGKEEGGPLAVPDYVAEDLYEASLIVQSYLK